ncbi:Fur family transcriptional regulator, ferric uptake regulator [Mariniphaga anaerophila]|uniref:Fur family transcriptional regulator, ferric uptake regulator n=1 Tax=Mariniphaga anaerophila TaxID=1484053 RepID=A0A1M5FDV0_9BACT|nr:transcriptional repressor [Mariniphaga anaerophila]SHF89715.1 Fur family transcriptional regulator, ferric uptake regulator [Mariniphaga anaerophila]
MKAVDILNIHNLKRTSCREGIIDVVKDANQALSENEIKNKLSGNYDRTTFYRSFKTLEESKIIHKIVVDSQLVKYALDNSITHKKEHAHFYCNQCHSVKCLEPVLLEEIKIPEGYQKEETEIVIKGTCAICKNKT